MPLLVLKPQDNGDERLAVAAAALAVTWGFSE
jgi:hypothetical protein